MRKTIFTATLLLLLICLTACQTGDSITNAELTERENMIADARSDQTFMYDYNVKNDYTSLKVWIEKYENGEKTQTVELNDSYNQDGIQNKGTIVISTESIDETGIESVFYTSIFSGGLHSCKEFNGLLEGTTTWSSLKNKAKLPSNGKMGLLCICCDNEGFFDINQDFFTDYSNNLSAIKDYDIAYLFVCEFSKN